MLALFVRKSARLVCSQPELRTRKGTPIRITVATMALLKGTFTFAAAELCNDSLFQNFLFLPGLDVGTVKGCLERIKCQNFQWTKVDNDLILSSC